MRSSVIFGFLAALLSLSAVSAQSKDAFINDMNTLNYALALENFEAYLYDQFVATFTTAASAGVSPLFYSYLTTARTSEGTHAQSLTAAIKAAGWLPAPACTYDLNQTDFGNLGSNSTRWLGLIALVEDVGAAAYTYASQLLTSSGYLQYAATVATVEARHAAFLNALVNATGDVTFGTRFGTNKGYNDALSVEQVVNALVANKFLKTCTNVTGNTFDGPKTFSVFDHTGTGAYVPKLANSFRVPAGTYKSAASTPLAFLNQAQFAQDTLVLQYALTAENLEAKFYADALAAVSREDFVAYFTSLNPYSSANASLVYDFLELTGAHEASHASFLTTVINSRAPNHAVPPCTYNLTALGFVNTSASLLTTARLLEDTGVQAYAGAITLLSDTNLVVAAASIALVEARHATYLRTLLKETGLLPEQDQSVDKVLTPLQVATTLVQLGTFLSCPNVATADPANPSLGVYSSATLKYDLLVPLVGGFGDNGAYNTLGTNVKTSQTGTTPAGPSTGPSTGSASAIVASAAVALSVIAMLL